MTGIQIAGICLEIIGLALDLLGLTGELMLLVFVGTALILLGLPLLLAKKHPLLICGWLAVGLSLLVFNPYTSVTPWGLIGGIQRLIFCYRYPPAWYYATQIGIAIAISRGLLSLLLLYLTLQAWKKARTSSKERQ